MQVGLPLTTTDLALMPDDGNRYELLEGELVVSRAPSLSHQRISGNIYAVIRGYLDSNPIGEIFATPGIVFDEFDSVIPDLVFVSHERRDVIVADDRFIAAPELVIEIVSPGEGNARRDRVTKRQIYSRFGVLEYWIVDPASQSIETYELDTGVLELRTSVTGQDVLRSALLPGLACPAVDIFLR
jgi:Uma2 family endonuclease